MKKPNHKTRRSGAKNKTGKIQHRRGRRKRGVTLQEWLDELWKIRQEAIKEGMKLWSWGWIRREVKDRHENWEIDGAYLS